MATKLEIQIKSVVKDIKALDVKLTKLLKEVESSGKAGPVKKVVAKKTAKKVAPAKKTIAKKAVKKNAQITAFDTIIGIIAQSKEGVTNPELMKKTGFDKKKVANILFKAKKKGRIKAKKKGVYLKA